MLLIIGTPPGALTTSILPLPVRSCFFNLSAPAHRSGAYESPFLPRKPEPPNQDTTQAQTELCGIDFDKTLVKLNELSSTLLHNSSTLTSMKEAVAGGLIRRHPAERSAKAYIFCGTAVSLCSSATPRSDERHLRSASSPSSLIAATKLPRSGGANKMKFSAHILTS
ncbi:hypothetical protein IGI04_037050 [Brassica rapa subsp. trilocularis]|uniref:Uncharacterized protein n=1 Tax=Brassica rapa subsp. trilocularis TaxID=1813537 RepID=A0ABQ7LHX1_BRACM|nr:hypothetical protein IGI04_037050 [Brassica rapa subsp. trilocularis]